MNDKPHDKPSDSPGIQLYKLADKVLGIVGMIVFMLLLIILCLIAAYLFSLLGYNGIYHSSANDIFRLIVKLWDGFFQHFGKFVTLIAPVFGLLFALGLWHRLGPRKDEPLDLEKLLSDLPSTLALLIIGTICLLPIAGVQVPPALNNIALVVVGFYFGKRKISEEQ